MKQVITKYKSIFLLLISIIAPMFDQAFLLNPFIIIVLYFSFYLGLGNYLLNSIIMCVIAFVMSRNYALEVMIIVITYLFSTCLFSLLLKKPKAKYYSLITLNILLIIVSMVMDFSINALCNALINTIFQFVIIKSLESVTLKIKDENHVTNILEVSLSLFFILSLTTFSDYFALIVLRVLLLFIVMKVKKEVSFLTLMLMIMYTIIFNKYSTIVLVALYLPFMVLLLLPKWRLVIYGLLSFMFLFFFPTPFYLNINFYGIMLSLIIYVTVKSEISDKLFSFINKLIINKNSEDNYAYASTQIQALNNYMSLIEESKTQELIDPFNNVINDVKENVCKKCDHYQYCSLKNDLNLFFKDKLTSKEKALITEKCITPYKLVMALTNSFKVYQKEQYYYNCYVSANKRYKHLIKCIESPLSDCSLKLKHNDFGVKQKILESGLHYYKCYMDKDNIEVVFNIDSFEEDDAKFEEFVKKSLANSYRKQIHKQNILSSTIQVSYLIDIAHTYDIGIVTKALDDNYNGDNYLIEKKNNTLYIVLCDGMGHGYKAQECSRYLLKAIQSHLNLQTNMIDMINDLNNLMLYHNEDEFYSTMDFIKINLSSLKVTFLKAGAFVTYLIRGQEITKIAKNNLPLGIVNEMNYDISSNQLQKDDILVIVSDGLGEKIEVDNKVLLVTPNVSMSQRARNIFELLNKNNKLSDDSTIIIIKIL